MKHSSDNKYDNLKFSNNPGPNLIFVGGCPRSGTSLLQKILINHSSISGGPEFDHIKEVINLYHVLENGITNQRQRFYYDQKKLEKVFRNFVEQLLTVSDQENLKYISEKTPSNIFVFNDLMEIFPNAKFIALIRDPRAILNSFRNIQSKAKKRKIKQLTFGKNLFLDLYRIDKSLKSIHLLNFNSRLMLISYEELVLNSKETIQKVCDHLGLSFTSDLLKLEVATDSNLLVNNDNLSKDFITDLFNKNISNTSLVKWQTDLPFMEKQLCSFYFKTRNYNILNGFKFTYNPWLLPFLIIYFTIEFCFFFTYVLLFHRKKLISYVTKNYSA